MLDRWITADVPNWFLWEEGGAVERHGLWGMDT